jgi:hypothetical protein
MNTTLIRDLPIENVANLAEWQAKHALRCGRIGDEEGFAVHANKMYDVLEAAKYPRLTTQSLVRKIGRGKAMVLQIERPIINLALHHG